MPVALVSTRAGCYVRCPATECAYPCNAPSFGVTPVVVVVHVVVGEHVARRQLRSIEGAAAEYLGRGIHHWRAVGIEASVGGVHGDVVDVDMEAEVVVRASVAVAGSGSDSDSGGFGSVVGVDGVVVNTVRVVVMVVASGARADLRRVMRRGPALLEKDETQLRIASPGT